MYYCRLYYIPIDCIIYGINYEVLDSYISLASARGIARSLYDTNYSRRFTNYTSIYQIYIYQSIIQIGSTLLKQKHTPDFLIYSVSCRVGLGGGITYDPKDVGSNPGRAQEKCICANNMCLKQ